MGLDEIRAEVARRKQRARDLKVRELLLALHKYFEFYRSWSRSEPHFAAQLIYPGVVLRDTDVCCFSIGLATFQLTHEDGEVSHEQFSERGHIRHTDTSHARGCPVLRGWKGGSLVHGQCFPGSMNRIDA